MLKPVTIADLRPTQITLGMREVEDRRRRWRALKDKKQKFLDTHMIPVIVGPKDRHYIIDHHHLVRALHDEGAEEVLVTVIANLAKVDEGTFWFVHGQSRLDASVRRTRQAARLQRTFPNPSTR